MAERTEPSDVELVGELSRGQRGALGLLYDRYASHLLALGIKMLGDRREAEDMVHDVFLEVWHRASSYEEARGTVASWLVLRMRSRCLDKLRAGARSKVIAVEDPYSLAGAPLGTEALQAAGDRATLKRALDTLPPEQREVLELGYFAGLSSPEIAETMSISIGTVKSRTAAGLSKLRARLHVKSPGGEG